MKIKGSVVLVTGANRGLGRAFAQALRHIDTNYLGMLRMSCAFAPILKANQPNMRE